MALVWLELDPMALRCGVAIRGLLKELLGVDAALLSFGVSILPVRNSLTNFITS